MAAILKVDTIQDTSGNNIINENANTVTIGKAGDTVNVVGTLQNNSSALVTGKVLQVVTATDSTSRSTTSTSFVTASNTLSVNITPSSASNKVFIIINTTMLGADAYYTIYRDATNLGTGTGFGGVSDSASRCAGAISVVDSPSTTSQITYQLYVKVASGTAYINVDGNKGSITAFEIGT
jgi:hypothetical protein